MYIGGRESRNNAVDITTEAWQHKLPHKNGQNESRVVDQVTGGFITKRMGEIARNYAVDITAKTC